MSPVTPSVAWNDMMMSPDRDCAAGRTPTRRYAVLSTPRSGSTLLCRALEATGQLGVPHEYLNPNAIAAAARAGYDTLGGPWALLAQIEPRRTSAEGWFGIKTHFRQFEQHFGPAADAEAAAFVDRQDRLILTCRGNHVAQAVSYYAARVSGRWTSEHDQFFSDDAHPPLALDMPALLDCLQEVEEGEKAWRRVISRSGASVLEIRYEDLLTNYPAQVARALDWLGLSAAVPPQPTRPSRQDPARAGLEAALRRHLASSANDGTVRNGAEPLFESQPAGTGAA